MCFNEEVSIIMFIIGVGVAIRLMYNSRNDSKKYKESMVAGILLITISLMQLLEYFMWTGVENCNHASKIANTLVLVLLISQPIIYLSSIYLFKIADKTNKIGIYTCIFLILILLGCLIHYYINIYRYDNMCPIKDDKSCRLKWNNLKDLYDYSNVYAIMIMFVYILLFLITATKLYKSYKGGYTFIVVSSLIVSIIYSLSFGRDTAFGIVGSTWCFLVVASIILLP